MAVLVHQTILEVYPSLEEHLKIKWPNDIILDDRKVCGILTSYHSWAKYLICGLGLDTNISEMPLELSQIAVSLKDYLNLEINNFFILKAFLDKLYQQLPTFIEYGFEEYQNYYNQFDYLKDRVISLDTEFQIFRGKVLKINKKGALIMELDENLIQPFYSGSVVQID